MQISNSSIGASFTQSSAGISRSSERIASGQRINSAADDAAGSAISNQFSAQIRGNNQAIRNANDGISLLQTASSSYESINNGIQRVRELSVQAANGTLRDSDRQAINNEAQQILSELSRTVNESQFNGKALFSNSGNIDLQVGPDSSDTLKLELNDFTQVLDDNDFTGIDLSSVEGASNALGALDQIQEGITASSATIGAGINRLESTIDNLLNSSISSEESRSQIRDADIAKEISQLTQEKIKQDAALALQAQANQDSKSILRLLQ